MEVHAVGAWTVRTYLYTGCLAVPGNRIGRMVPPSIYTANMIHIGHLIEEELLRQERSAAWLARKLYCDRTNIYKIFKRESIDTDLLLRISKALNHNFFQGYNNVLNSEL